MFRALLILAAVFAHAMTAEARDRTIHLILVAGQSNSVGVGALADWPNDTLTSPSQLWTFRKDTGGGAYQANRWQHPPVPNYQGTGVGPALPMADKLAELRPSYHVGIVPCGHGGTSIRQWRQSNDPDSLYGACVQQVRRSIKACPDGFRCVISGVFWWQGEEDAMLGGAYIRWLDQTERMFNSLRRLFENPRLPILYVRLGRANDYITNNCPYWDDVRDDQSELRRMFPDGRVRMLNIDSVAYPTGDLHMTTLKYIEVGHLAGEAMDELLP